MASGGDGLNAYEQISDEGLSILNNPTVYGARNQADGGDIRTPMLQPVPKETICERGEAAPSSSKFLRIPKRVQFNVSLHPRSILSRPSTRDLSRIDRQDGRENKLISSTPAIRDIGGGIIRQALDDTIPYIQTRRSTMAGPFGTNMNRMWQNPGEFLKLRCETSYVQLANRLAAESLESQGRMEEDLNNEITNRPQVIVTETDYETMVL